MTTLYLIRHGQASFGQENYDQLSDLGKAQAQQLGAELAKRLPAFDLVCLGSMIRHRQTAALCLAAMGHKFDLQNAQLDAAWNEYDHQNILAQQNPQLQTAAATDNYIRQQPNPAEAFESLFHAAIKRWISGKHQTGYTELWVDYKARINAAFDDVCRGNEQAKNIAIFTSGGPISVISQALLRVPETNLMHMNWTLVNCGVTKIVATKSRRFVASLNEHVHFEGEQQSLITYR